LDCTSNIFSFKILDILVSSIKQVEGYARGVSSATLIAVDFYFLTANYLKQTNAFNVHGSVHRNNIPVYKSQQGAQLTEFIFV
jgi:hypothetical protein